MNGQRVRAVVPAQAASTRLVRDLAASVASRASFPPDQLQQVSRAVGEAIIWILVRAEGSDTDIGVVFEVERPTFRVSLFHPGLTTAVAQTPVQEAAASPETELPEEPADVSLGTLAALVPDLGLHEGSLVLTW